MSTRSDSSTTQTITEQLLRHAPFDRMQPDEVSWLAQRLCVHEYARGEVLLSPKQGVADHFFIIRQGVVKGEQDVVRAQDDAAWLELHQGECFPLGALLSRRAVTSTYRASIETSCYALSAADFHALIERSVAFRDFCTRRIANLLEQSKQVIQAQYSRATAAQQSMTSPLAQVVRRMPVTCAPDTPIREVLQTMQDQGVGSMVAVEQGKPVGMFTLHDVLSRVALTQADCNQPIINVMSKRLILLPPQALVYEAVLTMARQGIRHVLVCDQDKLVGVLSEQDLFSLQRVGLGSIGGVLRNATHIDDLVQAARDIRQLGQNMLAQGVGAEQLTQIISTLNDLLNQRVIELELLAAQSNPEWIEIEFCWLALGSEGRFEQTLNTDQDNGIIFAPPLGMTADQARARLLPLALRINQALDRCGFPLCKGNIMASNPCWCLSLEEWMDTFANWIHRGDAPVLLNASIFFDFRPLFGKQALAHELRDWLGGCIKAHRFFLKLMVQNALSNHPPLGLLRDFVVADDTLDLKLNGITPFVDAARICSLAIASNETATLQRLRAACAAWHMQPSEVEGWIDAFLFIQLLRLRLQHQQSEAGMDYSNRVNPDKLNDLDRRILKEAFRQARKLQSVMEKFFTY
jgi:CBS domain-containing protein